MSSDVYLDLFDSPDVDGMRRRTVKIADLNEWGELSTSAVWCAARERFVDCALPLDIALCDWLFVLWWYLRNNANSTRGMCSGAELVAHLRAFHAYSKNAGFAPYLYLRVD